MTRQSRPERKSRRRYTDKFRSEALGRLGGLLRRRRLLERFLDVGRLGFVIRCRFVGEITFQALTGKAVFTDMAAQRTAIAGTLSTALIFRFSFTDSSRRGSSIWSGETSRQARFPPATRLTGPAHNSTSASSPPTARSDADSAARRLLSSSWAVSLR